MLDEIFKRKHSELNIAVKELILETVTLNLESVKQARSIAAKGAEVSAEYLRILTNNTDTLAGLILTKQ